jgi:hypothetical protein
MKNKERGKLSSLPFANLYRQITPEDFIRLFGGETPQIFAFVLSFCPEKPFIKKVIKLYYKAGLDITGKGVQDIEGRPVWKIREYLNKCSEEAFDFNFTRMAEIQAGKMLQRLKSNEAAGQRGKFNFPQPKIFRSA